MYDIVETTIIRGNDMYFYSGDHKPMLTHALIQQRPRVQHGAKCTVFRVCKYMFLVPLDQLVDGAFSLNNGVVCTLPSFIDSTI